jgi:hypothetical protein
MFTLRRCFQRDAGLLASRHRRPSCRKYPGKREGRTRDCRSIGPLTGASGYGVVLSLVAVLACSTLVNAGEVRLKNDTVIQGNPVQIQAVSKAIQSNAGEVTVYPITLVDGGMVRYYVPTRNVVDANRDALLGSVDKFKVPQRKTGPRTRQLGSIGRFLKSTQFNVKGRRRVVLGLDTARGMREMHIDQGIVEIGPKSLTVQALNEIAWEYAIATTSIPTPLLDGMIREVTDQKSQSDRFTIARFYVQAELYLQALTELESVAKDFPDLKARAETLALEVRQLLAQRLLDELARRRQSGQHYLAFSKARQFPTDQMSAAILRQVREILADYNQSQENGELALAMLGELQAEVKDEKLRDSIRPFRGEISDSLNFESLKRLRPFLTLAEDKTVSAEEKLALAYSAWVTGETNAIGRLDQTINLWQARFLILNYLRTADAQERKLILADLMRTEGVGPESVMQLIPFLPPVIETPGIKAGVAQQIQVDNEIGGVPADSPPVNYHVLLPTEYSPHHTYPVIVALHSLERTPEWELRWWGGTPEAPLQAQRHGYIVIAPEYNGEGDQTFSYSPLTHYRVLQSIRDARRRFNIDSDRIFLSGHGTGGDACFDIGLSHPDVFAGVIPISGQIERFSMKIWRRNAGYLPWYVIGGQLDRDKFEKNAPTINSMMLRGDDVILAEYIGRGYESFYTEIHRLFAWMELHQRQAFPREIEVSTLRPNNNRYYWLKSHTIPDVKFNGSPKTIAGSIKDGSDRWTTIAISSPAKKHTVWLSPDMVDFNLRVQVTVKGKRKFNDFVESDVEAILEDLRLRGDRQKVYQARLELE